MTYSFREFYHFSDAQADEAVRYYCEYFSEKGWCENNLHIFSYGCSEAKRMLDFRDWLRTDEGDRMLYGNTKKALVQREWHYLQDYADAKSDVVREIFSHMECRTPQEKDACEIMPCVIRPWRTEDAEDIAYAMNNRNVLDNLRDGIPFPYTPSDALEYMSVLAK